MLWLVALGSVGVLLRFWLGRFDQVGEYAYGTLAANFIGCLLIGWVSATHFFVQSEYRIFIMVGLLGALTTFSGFALEMLKLIEAEKYFQSGVYFVSMNLGCLLLVFIGRKLTSLVG